MMRTTRPLQRITGRLVPAAMFALTLPLIIPAQAATGPAARFGNAMATDPSTGKVVMFGGGTLTINYGDTWVWNGTNWKSQPSFPSPSSRKDALMTGDSETGAVTLFGGSGSKNDFWTWMGSTKSWTEETQLIRPPGSADRKAIAYDQASGKLVLFTHTPDLRIPQTWTWDSEVEAWTLENPATSPPPRTWASMTYDAVSQRVVLFGGDNTHGGGELLNDTWTWDGLRKTWTEEAAPTRPPARGYAYMAYHAATSKVVLFGGGAFVGDEKPLRLNDTWTWDGTTRTWTKQKPANRPCPRFYGAMAYHPATASAVIFGSWGACPGGGEPGTWAWNGLNWKQRA